MISKHKLPQMEQKSYLIGSDGQSADKKKGKPQDSLCEKGNVTKESYSILAQKKQVEETPVWLN